MTEINENEIERRLKMLADIHPSTEATNSAIKRVRLTLMEKRQYPDRKTDLWKIVMQSRLKKFAVAAVIFIAFGIGFFSGRQSMPAHQAFHLPDVTDYTSSVSMYPTAPKAEDSFWRQKALAAIQPRAYEQTLTTKTSLLNAYKQYLKEKHYD